MSYILLRSSLRSILQQTSVFVTHCVSTALLLSTTYFDFSSSFSTLDLICASDVSNLLKKSLLDSGGREGHSAFSDLAFDSFVRLKSSMETISSWLSKMAHGGSADSCPFAMFSLAGVRGTGICMCDRRNKLSFVHKLFTLLICSI